MEKVFEALREAGVKFTLTPPAQRQVGMVAMALGAGYVSLRCRLLPRCLMRAWFFVTVLLTVFPASALLYLLDLLRYLGIPRRWVQHLCVLVMVAGFKAAWLLNPQIRMTLQFDAGPDGKPTSWKDVSHHGIAIALNHTSFWDVFEVLGLMPVSHLLYSRTLMKSSLRKIPIFGGVFDRVGHFPVYFKSDEDGNFQVDKERQAAVQVDVNEHLRNGGNIIVFPEGAVNRTPLTLQPFRFGTFATIFEHRLPLYYMVAVGNEKTWPATAACGGDPADIHVRFGAYPIDFDTQDSKQVAKEMQEVMQQRYNEVVAASQERKGQGVSAARVKGKDKTA